MAEAAVICCIDQGGVFMLSKRVACFDQSVCVACGACVKECPRSAVSVFRGCHAVVDKERCVGCGKCAKICPAGCIVIRERESENGNEEEALV